MERLKGKKVLVTGGSGTLGAVLCRRLIEGGATVTAVSLDSDTRVKAVLPDSVAFLRRDLTDFANCREVAEGQDWICHLVAVKGNTQIGTNRVATDYRQFILCNTHMMEAAFQAGAERYLYVGSICAYPNLAVRQEDSLWDGSPTANDRFAGIAKRAGEIQGETYRLQHGWEAVRIVRPSNVYGAFDDFHPLTGQVIPALIARVLSDAPVLEVAGDGSVLRDFIYSEDCVEGMLRALLDAPCCLPINLGSGIGCSIRELVETLVEVVVAMGLKPRVEVVWDSSRPAGDPVRILDTRRAIEVLGFTPTTSLQEGLRRTVAWYVTNRMRADGRGAELHGAGRSA